MLVPQFGAPKNTYFSQVDELLLFIYYLYKMSPKKRHDLVDVVLELKHCLEPIEIPREGGNRPLRPCGTRFITHKVLVLSWLIDCFGSYTSYLSSCTEDSTVRAVDKQKSHWTRLELARCKNAFWMCRFLRYS